MAKDRIRLTAVFAMEDDSDQFEIGRFEPKQIRQVLALLKDTGLEHPDGGHYWVKSTRFVFGAKGDRPHFEIGVVSDAVLVEEEPPF